MKHEIVQTSSSIIKQKALSLGFSSCGIAPARKLVEEEQRLKDYLENHFHGEMGYMANHFDKRLDPTLLVPGAKSVVVVLLNYFPSELQSGRGVPIVSKYAYGKDYHIVVKERLQQLLRFIDGEIGPVKGRIFTDSAPLLEKTWAIEAGLGWIGKNGLLLNKELGSFFFIGELVIDLDLEYDQPYTKNHCGTCSRCLSACPTSALVKPYILDSRRCISYLTIELHGDIPDEFQPLLTNHVFGCDCCQDVCPWNRNSKPHSTVEFIPHPDFIKMECKEWKQLDESNFRRMYFHTAIERIGFKKFRSNVENVLSPINIKEI